MTGRLAAWAEAFKARPLSALGLALIVFFVVVAVFAPALAPAESRSCDPYLIPEFGYSPDPLPPSREHRFGTTQEQYDLYYGMVWGTRTAFRVALSVVGESEKPASEQVKPEHFSTAEFLAATGLEAVDANELIAAGLVVPRSEGRETSFSAIDVRVASAAAVLLARGVDARRLATLRRVVEREIGIVDEWTMPLRQPGASMDHDAAATMTRDVVAEAAALRAALFERARAEYLAE